MTTKLFLPEKRNIILNGRRTTLQLEGYVWQNLMKMGRDTNQPLVDLLNDIWRRKAHMAMAPAVRLFLMLYFTDYAERAREESERQIPHDPHRLSAAEPAPEMALNLAQQSYIYAKSRLADIARS